MKWIIALTFAFGTLGCGAATSAGAACKLDNECQIGQTCNNTFPGGFCSKGCLQEGSTDECPQGTICAQVTLGARYCAVICTEQSQCRDSYRCNGITASSTKACQP